MIASIGRSQIDFGGFDLSQLSCRGVVDAVVVTILTFGVVVPEVVVDFVVVVVVVVVVVELAENREMWQLFITSFRGEALYTDT